MPFRIALSGLNAASSDLKVTGNNIANAGTNGFKSSRAEFADVYATSLGGVSNTAVGGGVRLAQVSQQFAQGNIEFTNNNLDLAINGEGFYVLDDGGSKVFTRAGAFKVDRDGYVVNSSSQRLQVFSPIGNSSTAFNTGSLNNLQISLTEGAPNATASVDMSINLNASDTSAGTVAAFDPATPASYDYSTSYTVYDSLGAQHTATMYFLKDNVANNTWHTWLYADNGTASTNVTQGGAASSTLAFASDGSLATVNGAATTTLTYDNLVMSNGAAPLAMTLDYADLTQFGGDFAVNSLSQDGFATGRLTGLDLDDTGVVSARYTNGQSTALGKVALANFANVQGLRQLGETNWAETFGSGGALIGEAGTASFGLIQSGALESSNVDIAEQLINLITAQRNFQANSQVISTADTVTQTIINIR
jgi:flagellar hook protein FlgE